MKMTYNKCALLFSEQRKYNFYCTIRRFGSRDLEIFLIVAISITTNATGGVINGKCIGFVLCPFGRWRRRRREGCRRLLKPSSLGLEAAHHQLSLLLLQQRDNAGFVGGRPRRDILHAFLQFTQQILQSIISSV